MEVVSIDFYLKKNYTQTHQQIKKKHRRKLICNQDYHMA